MPTIQKLHAQLQGKKISPQSFADTANSEITSILQKTALKILTQIDPQASPHTRTTANSHVQPSRANHHSSKDPHEALLQRTIHFHRDALATLRKDLSLDDADTLAYHQNKLKQAQIDLLKSQTKKKQDKLLVNVACDHGDAGVTSGQNLGSMWNYLRKFRNNHAKNSLPPETRSNASTDARIWESGPATLNPINWYCYRFALPVGHHLFKHKLSPYDEKEATLISSRHTSVQAQASNATPNAHPLFMLPFTLLELTTQIKKLFPDKSSGPSRITNRMLQAGDAEFQSLLLLLFNGIWESHVQPTDCQLSLMQPIYKGHDKDKTDPASYRGKNLNDTLTKLFEGLLLARVTTHTESNNTLTSKQLGTKPCT